MGRILLGPMFAEANRVVKHSRIASATIFFLLLMLLTLFQRNYRLAGFSLGKEYKSYRLTASRLYPRIITDIMRNTRAHFQIKLEKSKKHKTKARIES